MLYGVCQLIISYLFGTFTDTIRKPMKIGCADGAYSHLNHAFTVSPASDPACSEQFVMSIYASSSVGFTGQLSTVG